jgi:carboxylesterase type B
LTTPISSLLATQDNIEDTATTIDPAAGFAEPIRPVLDGTLIQYSLTTTFPPTNKNLLLTTTKDEAGPAMYMALTDPLPSAYFDYIGGELYGPARTVQIESFYHVIEEDTDDIRPELVVIGTDAVWRCPNYAFAHNWASRGGNVWVAEYTVGATYPSNAEISFCTTNGAVCHQDDIPIVFGTTTSPTAAQTALTAQVQARWGAFIKTGNPNTSGFGNWAQVPANGSIPVLNLGGTDPIPLGGCVPSEWGGSIPFDYQLYHQ